MADTRHTYSYDDLFPERWLHAPDLDGRSITLTITDLYAETITNPKTRQADECGILSFAKTPREYVLSKQNAWILKTVFGPTKADVVGKRITLTPVPDTSGFTDHGIRILFTGSPDIDSDTQMTIPGGKRITFKKTAAKKGAEPADGVDVVTGEVTGQDDAKDAAPATQTGQNGDAGDNASTEPYAPLFAENGESDDEPPGRGPLSDNVTAIRPEPVAPSQLATITKLKAASGIYDAEFAALLDSYGAATVKDLNAETAGYVIAALKERQS